MHLDDIVAGALAQRRQRIQALQRVNEQHDVVQRQERAHLLVGAPLQRAHHEVFVGLALAQLVQDLQARDDNGAVLVVQPVRHELQEAVREALVLLPERQLGGDVAEHVEAQLVDGAPAGVDAQQQEAQERPVGGQHLDVVLGEAEVAQDVRDLQHALPHVVLRAERAPRAEQRLVLRLDLQLQALVTREQPAVVVTIIVGTTVITNYYSVIVNVTCFMRFICF